MPKEAARLEAIIHGYEAQLAAACRRVPRCTYDRGAFGRQVDKNEYICEDLNHFSVQGAAVAAAVAWAAMKQRGVIPNDPPRHAMAAHADPPPPGGNLTGHGLPCRPARPPRWPPGRAPVPPGTSMPGVPAAAHTRHRPLPRAAPSR